MACWNRMLAEGSNGMLEPYAGCRRQPQAGRAKGINEMSESTQRSMFRWVIRAAVLALVLVPQSVLACSVCGAAASEASKTAFIVSTTFMTVFPLLMIGFVAWWFVRRIRETDRIRYERVMQERAQAIATR